MSDEKDKVTKDSEETSSAEEQEETAEKSDAEVSEAADEKSDASEESAADSEASDEDADEASEEEVTDEDEDDSDDEDASDEDDSDDEDSAEEEASDDEEPSADEEESDDHAEASEPANDGHGHDGHGDHDADPTVAGVAAIFDHPDHLMYAATQARDSQYEAFDAFSPFPIHGMDDAMGLGRSWIPWVTFLAGVTGFSFANFMEFGIMWYDWPMVFGGRPFAAWPSFVPIMFELTVLFAGHTTAFVMLYAAGCFRKPLIIDPEITNDRFVLYISATDEHFNRDDVVEFMKDLNPMEVRTVRKEGKS